MSSIRSELEAGTRALSRGDKPAAKKHLARAVEQGAIKNAKDKRDAQALSRAAR